MLVLYLNSVIAYSVIVGALMASGKEVAGKIPKGKVCWCWKGEMLGFCEIPIPVVGIFVLVIVKVYELNKWSLSP